MSLTYTCDFCGYAIHAADYMAILRFEGHDAQGSTNHNGWVGHYHGGCREEMRDRIMLLHEHGQSMNAIPTITGQAVAARRRKHTRPAGPDAGAS